ncbi:MAG: hypothetical protein IJY13_01705, partial [Clostridia bacterium]|nr:hypothetical protein [Clostridia bacterium]
CNEVLVAQTVVPALGHSYNSVVTDPTCTDKGYTTHTCSVFGDVKVDTYVDANGHSWVDATCTTPKTCSVCGATEGTALDHSFTNYVSNNDATCTADGTETAKCDRCDVKDTRTDADSKLGHSWVDATCTTPKTCSVCGTTEGEALGHNYVGEVTTPATCTTKGVKTYTCSVCGDSYTEEIDSTGHSFTNYVSDNNATCTADGTKTAHCDNGCGETDTITDEGSKLGHSWVAATCTAPKTCSVCGATEGTALGHTAETLPGKDATCEETGLTEGSKCSVCGTVLVAQDVVPALGHNYGELIPQKDKTCTENGLKAHYKCSVCEAYFDAEQNDIAYDDLVIPADHTYKYTNNKIGTHQVTCEKCDLEATQAEHEYIDGVCVCGKEEPDSAWLLVENASGLNVGDQIVIVANGYNFAMSSTQNKNNRGQAAVTKGGDKVTFGDGVQIITLESGNVDGTFAFYVEGDSTGYLYAASSGSNYLRTEETLSNNSSWAITIAEGVATIVAQGSNTRNTMQYNQTSSLFACYASASQKALSIYKLSTNETCTHAGTTSDPIITEATCLEKGSKQYSCSYCDATWTEEIPALGHDYDSVVTDPTCTTEGYTTHTCSVCGDSYTSDTVPATGHDMDEGTITTPATCLEAGVRTYKCQNTGCAHSTTEEIPATGHGEADAQGKCPACGETIKVCDHVGTGREENIPIPATCTQPGVMTITCAHCHVVIQDDAVVEALGHQYGEWQDEIPATCVTTGTLGHKDCTRCELHFDSDNSIIEDLTITTNDSHELVIVTYVDYNNHTLSCNRTGCDYSETVAHNDSGDACECGLITSITGALSADVDAKVKLTGIVVDYYNSGTNSCYIKASVEDEVQFLIYSPGAPKAYIGDIVIVTGIIGQYNSVNQVNDGSVVIEQSHEHTYSEATCTKLATCSICGATTGELADHNYVDDTCTVCGAEEGVEITKKTYTFSDYTAGEQYAENEAHALDEIVTVVTTKCHFTTQLRIYSSETNNGFAIIESTKPITSIGVNAGNKADTLNVYGSKDGGATWTLIGDIIVTSTSYNDYTLDLGGEYQWLKLDVAGANQVRIASMTITYTETSGSETPEDETVAVEVTEDASVVESGLTWTFDPDAVSNEGTTYHFNKNTTVTLTFGNIPTGKKVVIVKDENTDDVVEGGYTLAIGSESVEITIKLVNINNCDHEFTYTYKSATEHTVDCTKCDFTTTDEHNAVEVPAQAPTCVATGLSKGSNCQDCNHILVEQTEVPATGEHNYVDGKCSVCGADEPTDAPATPVWTLVTNVSQLVEDAEVIIAAKGYNVAMSTTQNGNNRGQTAITKDGNDLATPSSSVQRFTLKAGKTSGTWAFYTGSGYLHAASSSSNYLRTETTLSVNSSWTVTIATDGIATIKATGSYTRNWMRYNSSSKIFACYGSGQADVCIYVLQ